MRSCDLLMRSCDLLMRSCALLMRSCDLLMGSCNKVMYLECYEDREDVCYRQQSLSPKCKDANDPCNPHDNQQRDRRY